MTVEFLKRANDFGLYDIARIHGPTGKHVDVSPFSPLECKISHQTKGKYHGFGVAFISGKNHRVIQIGSLGETIKFMNDLKAGINSYKGFFAQGTPNDVY